MPKSSKSGGFTLVELLVVISIISILSVIGITVYSNTQQSARDARRKGDIDAISKALEANMNSDGTYRTTISGTWFTGGAPPNDPTNTAPMVYTTTLAASSYTVCAKLDVTGSGNATSNVGDLVEIDSKDFYCQKAQQ